MHVEASCTGTWRSAECSLSCILQALERTLFFLCAMTQHQGDWQLALPGNPLEVRRACIAFLGWAKQPRAGELLPVTKAEKVCCPEEPWCLSQQSGNSPEALRSQKPLMSCIETLHLCCGAAARGILNGCSPAVKSSGAVYNCILPESFFIIGLACSNRALVGAICLWSESDTV